MHASIQVKSKCNTLAVYVQLCCVKARASGSLDFACTS